MEICLFCQAGLTENKTKPSSWGLAELGNKLSWVSVFGCGGYVRWVAGLTENKTKPSGWGLAELGNKLSLGSVFGCGGYVGWVAGLTENKTKPSSWGLAELGNKLSWVSVFKSRGIHLKSLKLWIVYVRLVNVSTLKLCIRCIS
jgi:hypothetical protein